MPAGGKLPVQRVQLFKRSEDNCLHRIGTMAVVVTLPGACIPDAAWISKPCAACLSKAGSNGRLDRRSRRSPAQSGLEPSFKDAWINMPCTSRKTPVVPSTQRERARRYWLCLARGRRTSVEDGIDRRRTPLDFAWAAWNKLVQGNACSRTMTASPDRNRTRGFICNHWESNSDADH